MTARQFLVGGAIGWVLFGAVMMCMPAPTWFHYIVGASVYIAVAVSLGCLLLLGRK
jgi:hypothetical protein